MSEKQAVLPKLTYADKYRALADEWWERVKHNNHGKTAAISWYAVCCEREDQLLALLKGISAPPADSTKEVR